MQPDKVSVIMGIYNCADTLPQAIDSIVAQTYKNWELILCDDASTDQTYQIAEQYQKRYPEKIVLLRNDVNSKLAYTLNHCLKYATGEYVARMDGDDLSRPERFEKQIQYLRKHPDIDLVGTAMQRFDENGMGIINYAAEQPDRYTLRNRLPFHHATIMTYRRVFESLGGYTVSDRTARCEDYDLWFRFYAAGCKGANLHDALYLVREDRNAVRRRTFKTRWRAFQTTRLGFTLLEYPKRWLVRKFFRMLFKSLIPFKAIDMYRKWQKEHCKSV